MVFAPFRGLRRGSPLVPKDVTPPDFPWTTCGPRSRFDGKGDTRGAVAGRPRNRAALQALAGIVLTGCLTGSPNAPYIPPLQSSIGGSNPAPPASNTGALAPSVSPPSEAPPFVETGAGPTGTTTRPPDAGVEPAPTLVPALSQTLAARYPIAPDALVDASYLQEGASRFGLQLHRRLLEDATQSQANLLISPYALHLGLVMLYGGALNRTREQMRDALRINLPDDRVHRALNSLQLDLARRESDAIIQKGFRLRAMASLWSPLEFDFQKSYLTTLARSYASGVRRLDFAQYPAPARLAINEWVAGQTEQRILDFANPSHIPAETSFLVLSTAYFKAAWAFPFDPSRTTLRPFAGLSGPRTAPMMVTEGTFAYGSTEDGEAVVLPYMGHETSFIAILPKDLAAFEGEGFDARLLALANSVEARSVRIVLPRFSLRGDTLSFRKPLQDLGIRDAFEDGTANFTAAAPRKSVLTDVLQRTLVRVDEMGTHVELPASTGYGTAPYVPDLTVAFEKPFLFLVRDDATKTLLFLGRVVQVEQ